MLIQTSVIMKFPQQEQENFEYESEYCKNAIILTKKSTVKDKTIITDAIIKYILQQYSPLYSLNAILLYCCKIKEDKWCGYVVVYSSKIRHMCCFTEDDIRCDGTMVLYLLSFCSLIWKKNNQWRLKLFNNVVRVLSTILLWIWYRLTMW